MPRPCKPASPFRYFNSSPEVIRLAVLIYVEYPLSLRNIEDMLHEREIDISHETVRQWWNRLGPMFAADINRQRVSRMQEVGRSANNRVENRHLSFRRREWAMLRFRRMACLQKFASVHANVHNHFNAQRHLVDRPT